MKAYFWQRNTLFCTSSPDQLFLKFQLTQISLNFQTFCYNLKIKGLLANLYVFFFCCFYFERNYDVLKWNCLCFSLNKNTKFDKNDTELKMENVTQSFRVMNLMLQLEQDREVKVNLWWIRAREWKKRAYFNLYFVRRKFF